jgi:DNA-binding MarR family transcriptional regulator
MEMKTINNSDTDKINNSSLNELLLDAWLNVSTVIWNERIVKKVPYNEALVLNRLIHAKNQGKQLTAKDLCNLTNIQKPQMNLVLNKLEEKDAISRQRVEDNRRFVAVSITCEGENLYHTIHMETAKVLEAFIRQIGKEDTKEVIRVLNMISDSFNEVNKDIIK